MIIFYRIKGSDEALKIFSRYDDLIAKIKDFKQKYFNDWTLTVPKIIKDKTNNMILARQGSDLILNFSPMVSDLTFLVENKAYVRLGINF